MRDGLCRISVACRENGPAIEWQREGMDSSNGTKTALAVARSSDGCAEGDYQRGVDGQVNNL